MNNLINVIGSCYSYIANLVNKVCNSSNVDTNPLKLLENWECAMRDLGKTNWRRSGFHMGYWAYKKLPKTPLLYCGTVCCGYGVGTTLPSWKAAGLGLVPFYGGDVDGTFPHWRPVKNAKSILGLTESQWGFITDPGIITPTQVADRILEVIIELKKQ